MLLIDSLLATPALSPITRLPRASHLSERKICDDCSAATSVRAATRNATPLRRFPPITPHISPIRRAQCLLRAGLSLFTFHRVPGRSASHFSLSDAFSCGSTTGEGYPPFSLVCRLLLLLRRAFSGSSGGLLCSQPGDPFSVSGFPSSCLVWS